MKTFSHSRLLPFSAPQVFAAFSDPVRLARWWGPAGFTNTFKVCEFKPSGKWSFVMHGPDGRDYINESSFVEIEEARKVVIGHFNPNYRLTVTLAPEGEGTRVEWKQVFESEAVAEGISEIVKKGNEENLDKLAVELGSQD